MNSLIVEVNENKYLIRYQVLKSVVSRKHTLRKVPSSLTSESATKTGEVIQRLEKHPVACEIYLYKINNLPLLDIDLVDFSSLKKVKLRTKVGYLEYLGRGLSKCSDKDKFDKNLGIRVAISNIEELDVITKHDINYKILNTKL